MKKYDEAWLSLVERCVRDAEVACSNHVASIGSILLWILPLFLHKKKPLFLTRVFLSIKKPPILEFSKTNGFMRMQLMGVEPTRVLPH